MTMTPGTGTCPSLPARVGARGVRRTVFLRWWCIGRAHGTFGTRVCTWRSLSFMPPKRQRNDVEVGDRILPRDFPFRAPMPSCINIEAREAASAPPDWSSRIGAVLEAKRERMLFRLAGRVTISVALADKKHRKDIMNDLAATDTRAAKSQGNLPVFWARTGEPPAHNCVSVLRLADWIEKGRLVIGGPGGADGALRVLYSMASLMEPAGPWKQPVARFVAPMPTALSTQHVDLTFHVYLGRLAFELISFSATKDLFSAMEPVSVVVPTRKRPEYPPTFRSPHGEPEGAARFTLPGVMRMAEHNGYREDEQPAGLTVTMFPFQRQTLAWMSDQEAWDLNQLMWEERQWLEGDCFFVFPLGGECRVHAPPRVTGGLLSEEMGLGKTLEVVALVLADKAKGYPEPKGGLGRGGGGARGPSRGRRGRGKEQGVAAAEVEHSDAEDDEADLRGARATLVVCPTTLIGQWDAEIAKLTIPGTLRVMTYPPEEANENGKRRATASGRADDRLVASMERADVVLTTYAALERDAMRPGFRPLHAVGWRRVVLDECQEIRSSTTALARLCASMRSVHRWMVSGTPLYESIDDVHGELHFLRVWPFALPDSEDGFWGHCVSRPWSERDPAALGLLQHLLRAVMVRHSKAQVTLAGEPLLSLPSASAAVLPVMADGSDLYMMRFVEAFAAETAGHMTSRWRERQGQGGLGPDLLDPFAPEAAEGVTRILQHACSGVATLLQGIEVRRIHDLVRAVVTASLGDARQVGVEVPAMTARRALAVLMRPEAVQDRNSDMVRHGDGNVRQLHGATRTYAARTVLEQLEEARGRMAPLQDTVARAAQVVGMRWRWAAETVAAGTGIVSLARMSLRQARRLFAVLRAMREVERLEQAAAEAAKGAQEPATPADRAALSRARVALAEARDASTGVTAAFVVRGGAGGMGHVRQKNRVKDLQSKIAETVAAVAQARVDLAAMEPLVAKLEAAQRAGAGGLAYTVLERSGFQAIQDLISGGPLPTCVICHCPAQEPCVTRCVHMACFECMTGWLRAAPVLQNQATQFGNIHAVQAPCPLCRRPFTVSQLIRIVPDEAGAEAEAEAGPSGAAGAPEPCPPKKRPRWSAATRRDELDAILLPPGAQLRPDPRTPALPPEFHAHAAAGRSQRSAKMRALVDILRGRHPALVGRGELRKVVVFSQFPAALRVVQQVLEEEGIGCAAIMAGMRLPLDPKDPTGTERLTVEEARRQAVTVFNVDPACRAFLLHVGVAAAGLTLTVADTMVMLEPLASAADEAQCRNRIHRIGQSRAVRCITLYTEDSAEERLLVWRAQFDTRHAQRGGTAGGSKGRGVAGPLTPGGKARVILVSDSDSPEKAAGPSRPAAGGPVVVVSDEEEELCVLAHEDRHGEGRRRRKRSGGLGRLRFLAGVSETPDLPDAPHATGLGKQTDASSSESEDSEDAAVVESEDDIVVVESEDDFVPRRRGAGAGRRRAGAGRGRRGRGPGRRRASSSSDDSGWD